MISVRYSRMAKSILAGYRACLIVAVLGLMLFGTSAASAQSIFASLSGTVSDSQGAVVPGAIIAVRNASTNVMRNLVTNGSGYFSATQLPIGTYDVSAEAKGFQKWQGTGIVLNGADNKTVNISLKVGIESVTVEVSASAGEIDVTNSGARAETITLRGFGAALDDRPQRHRNSQDSSRRNPDDLERYQPPSL